MRMTLKALLCAALSFCLLPLLALSAENADGADEVLKLITEKARAREALFDGYDVSGSVRVNSPLSLLPSGSATFRSVVSGERFLLEGAADFTQNGEKSAFSSKLAFDGDTHVFVDDVTSAYSPTKGAFKQMFDFQRASNPGVTQLIDRPGHLSSHLSAGPLSPLPPGLLEYSGSRYETTLHDYSPLDDSSLVVVDCALIGETERWPHKSVQRLYFDPALDYSCVKLELGMADPETGSLDLEATFLMSDFREVKPGLLLPFSIGIVSPLASASITVDSVDFPDSFPDSTFNFDLPRRDEMLEIAYDNAFPDSPVPDDPAPRQEATNVPLIEGTNVPPDAAPAPLQEGTNVPVPPDEKASSKLPLILLALAALCVALFLLSRRNKSQ